MNVLIGLLGIAALFAIACFIEWDAKGNRLWKRRRKERAAPSLPHDDSPE